MKKIKYVTALLLVSAVSLSLVINSKNIWKKEKSGIKPDAENIKSVSGARPETGNLKKERETENMRAVLKVGNKTYNIKFYNMNAAKDFYNMLPLKLSLSDYANSEKITSPNDKSKKFNLDTSDVKLNDVGKTGNISFYKPWGNIALFYKDGPEGFSGLVNIGEIEEGGKWLEELRDDFEVIIEKSEK